MAKLVLDEHGSLVVFSAGLFNQASTASAFCFVKDHTFMYEWC